MKKLDCFVKGSVKLEAIMKILDEYPDHIFSHVVSILNDDGKVIAYHFLASRAFVKNAKIKYPKKVFLYSEVISYFDNNGIPLHVFGPFGRIHSTTDIDDESKDVSYKSGSNVACSKMEPTKEASVINER